jgi:hypothetical protein
MAGRKQKLPTKITNLGLNLLKGRFYSINKKIGCPREFIPRRCHIIIIHCILTSWVLRSSKFIFVSFKAPAPNWRLITFTPHRFVLKSMSCISQNTLYALPLLRWRRYRILIEGSGKWR